MTMTARELVSKFVLRNQTALFSRLEMSGELLDNVENWYDEETEEYKEVLSWYLVDEWLYEELRAKGEPVLETDFGEYWGRTTYGQLIEDDGIIKDITAELNE